MLTANFFTHKSIPTTLMPEGSRIWVFGVGVGSNRPATNFPRISVDSNRFNCLVENGGLVIERRLLQSPIKPGRLGISSDLLLMDGLQVGVLLAPRGRDIGNGFRINQCHRRVDGPHMRQCYPLCPKSPKDLEQHPVE